MHISTSTVIELAWFIIAEQNVQRNTSSQAEMCCNTFARTYLWAFARCSWWCLGASALQLTVWCLPLSWWETFMQHGVHTPTRRTQTCTLWGHSLYLPARPSLLVHSVMQRTNREARRGRKGVDTVTAAPVAHDEVYTPLPCLVSITPPLALGQSARWHLCAARASQWRSIHPLSCWHRDSLLLPVDMSASSPSLYLSVSLSLDGILFAHLNMKGMKRGFGPAQ